MVAPYKPHKIQSAQKGNTGGRGSTRWMNPEDFEERYGYDYTEDPNFDSRSDAGVGHAPLMPEGGDYDLEALRASAGSIGGGYGRERKEEQSRNQMNLTSGRTSSILTEVSKLNR